MWGFLGDIVDGIKDLAGNIWGGLGSLVNGLKWLIHRLIGILEMLGSAFGLRFQKKLKLKVIILLDARGTPVARRADVEAVVTTAKDVFKRRANVRIVSHRGKDDGIVTLHPEPAPSYVMNPHCEFQGFLESLSKMGRWYRRYSARTFGGVLFGYGTPATIYVVNDVIDAQGCFIAVAQDYGFIDKSALFGGRGEMLVLAHELGHACDLRDRSSGTLMEGGPDKRTDRLLRREIAILRSSPRVTYF